MDIGDCIKSESCSTYSHYLKPLTLLSRCATLKVDMELKDRLILVTGGAHRLGKVLALAFARQGAHIVFTYNSSAEAARETQQEIQALGVRALVLRCDQSETAQVEDVVEEIRLHFGRLDGLINNAASFQEMSFWEATPDGWDKIQDVNLRGPFFFTQAAARLMQVNDGGVILNLLDESTLRPGRKYAIHGVSKHALGMVTRLSALALAPRIRVNAILAGNVLKPEDWTEERWTKLDAGIPMQRTGSPEDICQAALYLFAADYVTGAVLTVDGGRALLATE
jgi:pteridine reductase